MRMDGEVETDPITPKLFLRVCMSGIKRGDVTVSATIMQTLHEVYIRQTQASMGVPGSWSSLLRDRYSAIVSSRSIHIALPLRRKIFNASSCSCHEGTEKTRDCTFSRT